MSTTALNTKQMTVEEIRKHIVSTHNVDPQVLLNIKGKSNLVNFLLSLEKSEPEEVFETKEMDMDEEIDEFELLLQPTPVLTAETVGKSIPDRTDPEWTEYVLAQLTDKEKEKDYPKADGLRRLVEKLIGPINKIYTTVIQPPQKDNFMTATIKTTVELADGSSYDACTDVQKEHLQHPFDKHISAIAETRAEGRAYRKILRLQNIVTQEEMVTESGQRDQNKMSTMQIAFIDLMCNNTRLNINVRKIFDSNFADKKLDNIKNYSNEDVAKICSILSEYQADLSKIPADIRGYKPTWKD
jgi:hypothetical protein